MQCNLCSNPANTELRTLTSRSVCLSCALAIAEALPRLKTQPCRRQAICMRLHEHGIEALTANKQVIDLAKWGISDEQIRGACEIAKKRNALSFGYVYGVLKNEHERNNKPPPMPEPVEIDVPVRAKEEWERQGFASQADYEACDHAFTKAKFRNTRLTWVEHKEQWKGVM